MLPVINHGDVAFMVIATVLVAVMTPGLAFFYGGLVEKKNSLTMMFQSFVAIGIVTIMWIFGGFSYTTYAGSSHIMFSDTLYHHF